MQLQARDSKQEEILSPSSNSITEIVETLEVLEMTAPSSFKRPEEITEGDITSSRNKAERLARIKRQIQFLTMCLCFVQEGWNDGSTGPLLPRMQSYYRVRLIGLQLTVLFIHCPLPIKGKLQELEFSLPNENDL